MRKRHALLIIYPSHQSFHCEDGRMGEHKNLSPNLTGPHLGSKVFTIDTWSLLHKYWLRRPDIHWMALKRTKKDFISPPYFSRHKTVWCHFIFILLFWKAASVYWGFLETLIGSSGCDSVMTSLSPWSHTHTHTSVHKKHKIKVKVWSLNSALWWSGRCGSQILSVRKNNSNLSL